VRSGAHRLGNPRDLVLSDITKRGIDDHRWNPENYQGNTISRSVNGLGCRALTPLSNGSTTRVGTVQTSHETDGLAVQVHLVVEGPLREDGSLTGVEDVGDESRPVFLDETDFEVRSG